MIVQNPFVSTYNYLLEEMKASKNTTEKKFVEAWISGLTSINLKSVSIDKSLIPMLENTDNKLFYRHLFNDVVFINQCFNFDNITVLGMMVVDLPNKIDGVTKSRDLLCSALFFDEIERVYYLEIGGVLAELKVLPDSPYLKKSIPEIKRIKNKIHTIVFNIIDFIQNNQDDLRIINCVSDKKQNEKRIIKGKVPLPTRIIIKPKDHFLKYLNEFNNEIKGQHGYRYLVRGHWRHYRNEEHWAKELIGTSKWIKPFFKGHGIIINKEYRLMSAQNTHSEQSTSSD